MRSEIQQAIALVNNATETAWFNTLIGAATAVVFPNRRVSFHKPDGALGTPLQGQAVIYVGPHATCFLKIFEPFGWGANVR